jgi:VanZ family protein
LPVFIWALFILALSIGPGVQMPEVIFSPDKIGHLVGYGMLNGLMLWAVFKNRHYSFKTCVLSTLGVSVYGVVLEFVQGAFFPHRFFEVWDMAANVVGALISVLAFHFFIIKT